MSTKTDLLRVRIVEAFFGGLKFELSNCSCCLLNLDTTLFNVAHPEFFIAIVSTRIPENQFFQSFIEDIRFKRNIRILVPKETVYVGVDVLSLFRGREYLFSNDSSWIVYWGFPFFHEESMLYSHGSNSVVAN